MNKKPCPHCAKGSLVEEVINDFPVKIGGLEFAVPQAMHQRCDNCGKTIVSAAELKRWEELARTLALDKGVVPPPDKVRELREKLGLSAADLANLLAVTRQTVHAWERVDTGGISLGPASLLLKLIEQELAGSAEGIVSTLMALATERGIELKTQPHSRATPKPPILGCIRSIKGGMPRWFRNAA